MTTCTYHPEAAATAYCRTCGKALCESCKRDVRAVIYCEECIAASLQQPAAGAKTGRAVPAGAPVVTDLPRPGVAAWLGLIPGVGAMYNGQFVKGFIHAIIFIALVFMADNVSDVFGFAIAFFIFYMAFEAHRTARSRYTGEVVPDPFGINRMTLTPNAGSTAPSVVNGGGPPVGAIVLIGLGVLFLLNNLGILHGRWIHQFWPVILIVIGVYLFIRRTSDIPAQGGGNPNRPPDSGAGQ